MPLDPQTQEIFTMVTAKGLYKPTRVLHGVLNLTSYSQGTMRIVLEGLLGKISESWVDDIGI